MSTPAVEARALRKEYGQRVAVDDVDLTVRPGDVYGYLGPNGAGKTTSLRMMLGLIQPTGGTVELFGRDPQDDPIRALEGVAGFVEDPTFYPYLSGRTNLELLSALDGGVDRVRIREVLDIVELTDRDRDRVRGYSHGMRQRLGIAAALLRRPRLLVLDEPTTGLDPAGMRDMRELVRGLAGEGITVLLSSHLMVEVEALCNRLAVIQEGRIRFEGGLEELLSAAEGRYALRTTDAARALELCRAGAGIADVAAENGLIRFAADADAAARLTVELGRAGIGIHALIPETASLEQLFFELTEGREEEAR
jgi:ABC-2 type transport system ATP-binding protein